MEPDKRGQSGDAPSVQPPIQQDAAANVIRSQIDALYGDSPVASAPQQADDNPYHRTHSPAPAPQADQWRAYHSAWQEYYQKYYEGYYASQHAQKGTEQPASGYFAQATDLSQTTADLSKDQALFELRQNLLGRVRERAGKIRRSRHFVPIAAALIVVLIFTFIQYNRVFVGAVYAYVSPGAINPQNIVIDPTADTKVGPENLLVIPKINVEVPTIYDTTPAHDDQMAAMEKGVAYFGIPGANSKPGEIGNTVFSGHSSNDLFDSGDYKFIFAQLDKLNEGDTIYMHYNGTRYTYVVTKKQVVKPTQVDALIYPTDKPMLTLITCTPLGTAIDRLLVTAEQVSPDPAQAAAAPAGSGEGSDNVTIPGSAPTLFERLFGA